MMTDKWIAGMAVKRAGKRLVSAGKLKRVSLVIIYYTSFIPGYAQSPYELKTGREVTWLGVGAASLGAWHTWKIRQPAYPGAGRCAQPG